MDPEEAHRYILAQAAQRARDKYLKDARI
jgi:hypothetical protein